MKPNSDEKWELFKRLIKSEVEEDIIVAMSLVGSDMKKFKPTRVMPLLKDYTVNGLENPTFIIHSYTNAWRKAGGKHNSVFVWMRKNWKNIYGQEK